MAQPLALLRMVGRKPMTVNLTEQDFVCFVHCCAAGAQDRAWYTIGTQCICQVKESPFPLILGFAQYGLEMEARDTKQVVA